MCFGGLASIGWRRSLFAYCFLGADAVDIGRGAVREYFAAQAADGTRAYLYSTGKLRVVCPSSSDYALPRPSVGRSSSSSSWEARIPSGVHDLRRVQP